MTLRERVIVEEIVNKKIPEQGTQSGTLNSTFSFGLGNIIPAEVKIKKLVNEVRSEEKTIRDLKEQKNESRAAVSRGRRRN